MAGETINYYYLGYLIYGTLSRIAGITTWVGYNLALATTASMASVAAGGAAYNVVRRGMSHRVAWLAAVLGGFFVVMAGNMRAAVELVRAPSATWDQGWWGTVGWASSRVIVDGGQQFTETINEFPWFSLLLGDLHPHLTALPFTILAIVLAVSAVLTGSAERPDRAGWGKLVVAGMLVGALYPLNSLDFPTYLVLLVLAIAVVGGWNRRTLEKVAVVGVASLVAWLPFTLRFVSFAGGDTSQLPSWLQDVPVLPRLLTTIAFYKHERTSVGEFLTVFGLFWIIAMLYLGLAPLATVCRAGTSRRAPLGGCACRDRPAGGGRDSDASTRACGSTTGRQPLAGGTATARWHPAGRDPGRALCLCLRVGRANRNLLRARRVQRAFQYVVQGLLPGLDDARDRFCGCRRDPDRGDTAPIQHCEPRLGLPAWSGYWPRSRIR